MVVDRVVRFSWLFACLASDSSSTDDLLTPNGGCEMTDWNTSRVGDLVLLQVGVQLTPLLSETITNSAGIGVSNDVVDRRDDSLMESLLDEPMRSRHNSLIPTALSQSHATNTRVNEPETSAERLRTYPRALPRVRAKLQALKRDLSRLQQLDAQEHLSELFSDEPVTRSQPALVTAMSLDPTEEHDLELRLGLLARSATIKNEGKEHEKLDEPFSGLQAHFEKLGVTKLGLISGGFLLLTLTVLFSVTKLASEATFHKYRHWLFHATCFIIVLPLTICFLGSLGILQEALGQATPWIVIAVFIIIGIFPCVMDLYFILHDYHEAVLGILDMNGDGKITRQDVKGAIKDLMEDILPGKDVKHVIKDLEQEGQSVTKGLAPGKSKSACC